MKLKKEMKIKIKKKVKINEFGFRMFSWND